MKIQKLIKWVTLPLGVLLLFAFGFYAYALLSFEQQKKIVYQVPDFKIHEEVLHADPKLGQRIVTVRNGCIECHGPDLGGKLIVDDPAMGKFYSANITPFALKDWTDEQIAKVIRHGINREGHSIMFMPSFDFQEMSKEDIAAVIAYIRTVPSVDRQAIPPKVGPLGVILSALGKVPVLFPAQFIRHETGFTQKLEEGPTPEFGKYLVHVSCAGCHGPELRGGPIAGAPPSWPPASNLRLGSSSVWNEKVFNDTIKTGISPITHQALRFPMPVTMLQQMNETELKAMWLYLKDLKN